MSTDLELMQQEWNRGRSGGGGGDPGESSSLAQMQAEWNLGRGIEPPPPQEEKDIELNLRNLRFSPSSWDDDLESSFALPEDAADSVMFDSSAIDPLTLAPITPPNIDGATSGYNQGDDDFAWDAPPIERLQGSSMPADETMVVPELPPNATEMEILQRRRELELAYQGPLPREVRRLKELRERYEGLGPGPEKSKALVELRLEEMGHEILREQRSAAAAKLPKGLTPQEMRRKEYMNNSSPLENSWLARTLAQTASGGALRYAQTLSGFFGDEDTSRKVGRMTAEYEALNQQIDEEAGLGGQYARNAIAALPAMFAEAKAGGWRLMAAMQGTHAYVDRKTAGDPLWKAAAYGGINAAVTAAATVGGAKVAEKWGLGGTVEEFMGGARVASLAKAAAATGVEFGENEAERITMATVDYMMNIDPNALDSDKMWDGLKQSIAGAIIGTGAFAFANRARPKPQAAGPDFLEVRPVRPGTPVDDSIMEGEFRVERPRLTVDRNVGREDDGQQRLLEDDVFRAEQSRKPAGQRPLGEGEIEGDFSVERPPLGIPQSQEFTRQQQAKAKLDAENRARRENYEAFREFLPPKVKAFLDNPSRANAAELGFDKADRWEDRKLIAERIEGVIRAQHTEQGFAKAREESLAAMDAQQQSAIPPVEPTQTQPVMAKPVTPQEAPAKSARAERGAKKPPKVEPPNPAPPNPERGVKEPLDPTQPPGPDNPQVKKPRSPRSRSGHVVNPLGYLDLGKIGDATKKGGADIALWMKRQFKSGGTWTKRPLALQKRKEGVKAFHGAKLHLTKLKLNSAMLRQWKGEPPTWFAEAATAYMRGEPTSNPIPADIRKHLDTMRAHVDSLSQLAKQFAGNEELEITIDQNMGTYITRTYKKFREGDKWTDHVLKDKVIMKDFAAYVQRIDPKATEQDAINAARVILNAGTVSPHQSNIVNRVVDTFHRRENIPPEMRALLGEDKEAWQTYAQTVGYLSTLVANKKFVQDLKADGLKYGYLFDIRKQKSEKAPHPVVKGKSAQDIKQAWAEWRAENEELEKVGSFARYGKIPDDIDPYQFKKEDLPPQLMPLVGLVADRELARNLMDLYSVHVDGTPTRWYLAASGLIKAGQTIYELAAHPRNLYGNLSPTLLNGVNPVSKESINGLKAMYAWMRGADNPALEAKLERMAELGLLEAGVGSELENIAHRVGAKIPDTNPLARKKDTHIAKRAIGKTLRGLKELYKASDWMFKVIAFDQLKPKWQKAYPNAKPEGLDRALAAEIRRTQATYEDAPKAVKWVSRIAPVGPYGLFNAEIWRTQFNRVKIIMEDITSSNKHRQSLAHRRIIGAGVFVALMRGSTMVSDWLWGVEEEEREAIRKKVAPWNTNAHLAIKKTVDANGEIKYAVSDLGWVDPMATVYEPLIALGRGQPGEAVAALAQPFISTDPLAAAIMEAFTGVDQEGRIVSHPGLSPAGRFEKAAERQLKQLGGGPVKLVKGVVTDPKATAYRLTGLPQFKEVDLDTTDFHKNLEFNKKIQASDAEIRRHFLSRKEQSPAYIERMWRSAEKERRKSIGEWGDSMRASETLGSYDIEGKVKRDLGGLPATFEMAYGGYYEPYNLSEEARDKIMELPDGPARLELFEQLYYEALEAGQP